MLRLELNEKFLQSDTLLPNPLGHQLPFHQQCRMMQTQSFEHLRAGGIGSVASIPDVLQASQRKRLAWQMLS